MLRRCARGMASASACVVARIQGKDALPSIARVGTLSVARRVRPRTLLPGRIFPEVVAIYASWAHGASVAARERTCQSLRILVATTPGTRLPDARSLSRDAPPRTNARA